MKFLLCVVFVGLLATVLAVAVVPTVVDPIGVRAYNPWGWRSANLCGLGGCGIGRGLNTYGYGLNTYGLNTYGLNTYGYNRPLINTYGYNNLGLVGGYGTYGRAMYGGLGLGLGYNKFL